MKIRLKSLEKIDEKYARHLVNILNDDKKLIEFLGGKKEIASYEKFTVYNEEWSRKNNAKIFAIMLQDEAIGMISLSYINTQDKTAKIGYWLASKYWNKGYVTEAFKQTLNIAKESGIKSVSCSIPNENKASKAIWKKFNASFKEEDGKIIPLIYL